MCVCLLLNSPESLVVQVTLSLLLILPVPVEDAVRLNNYTNKSSSVLYVKSNR